MIEPTVLRFLYKNLRRWGQTEETEKHNDKQKTYRIVVDKITFSDMLFLYYHYFRGTKQNSGDLVPLYGDRCYCTGYGTA